MAENKKLVYWEVEKISCLPKTGKLRIVMKDGSVQEINLSSVSELTVKP